MCIRDRKSTAIFVLEQETLENYSAYNKHTVHVGNSIVVHPYEERKLHEAGKAAGEDSQHQQYHGAQGSPPY